VRQPAAARAINAINRFVLPQGSVGSSTLLIDIIVLQRVAKLFERDSGAFRLLLLLAALLNLMFILGPPLDALFILSRRVFIPIYLSFRKSRRRARFKGLKN
jgi:hypothetical protein